jgi:hypothetical protein
MTVYLVSYADYEGNDTVGYFTDKAKAEECCRYMNKRHPSDYEDEEFMWHIFSYTLDPTDYASLNKELAEKERQIFERKQEIERQAELAELARLKAKYESN